VGKTGLQLSLNLGVIIRAPQEPSLVLRHIVHVFAKEFLEMPRRGGEAPFVDLMVAQKNECRESAVRILDREA
jgi:hypothetical protein